MVFFFHHRSQIPVTTRSNAFSIGSTLKPFLKVSILTGVFEQYFLCGQIIGKKNTSKGVHFIKKINIKAVSASESRANVI